MAEKIDNSWNGPNRRRHPRADFPYTIHICSPAGRSIATYTEDVSCGGVKVITQQAFKLGEEVVLKIYAGEHLIACTGKVVWVREKTASVLEGVSFFNAGIEFCDLSPENHNFLNDLVTQWQARKPVKGKK